MLSFSYSHFDHALHKTCHGALFPQHTTCCGSPIMPLSCNTAPQHGLLWRAIPKHGKLRFLYPALHTTIARRGLLWRDMKTIWLSCHGRPEAAPRDMADADAEAARLATVAAEAHSFFLHTRQR